MTSTSLTLRRQKLVSEYVETGNATQAATLAGYSPRTAYSQGSRLLTFVEVQQAIETERQTLRAREELDQDQLVGELLSLYREAREHRAYSAAARCLGMVAQMTGLDKPEPKPNANMQRFFDALNARLPAPPPAKSLGDGTRP
jgi:phage terminase small subunit